LCGARPKKTARAAGAAMAASSRAIRHRSEAGKKFSIGGNRQTGDYSGTRHKTVVQIPAIW
jgi:hypothetical protein